MAYSANFRAGRKFRPFDIVVGDSIDAYVEKEHLFVMRPSDGKTEKAKIVKRARIEPTVH